MRWTVKIKMTVTDQFKVPLGDAWAGALLWESLEKKNQ